MRKRYLWGKRILGKKVVAVALTGVLALSCLAGCSSKDGQDNNTGAVAEEEPDNSSLEDDQEPEENKEMVKLQVWGGIPAESGLDQMAEAFNSSHDNIQIEYVYYTNDDAGNTKLDMSLMAGGDADVFFSHNDPLLNKRIDSGNTLELTDFFEKYNFDPVEALGEGITAYSRDGAYYYLPTTMSNTFMLYNRDMFEEAGIELPSEGWTYEEFYNAVKALTKDGVYGFYFPSWDAGQPATAFANRALGEDWMYKEDGTGVQIDRPEIRDAFEKYMARVEEGLEVDFIDNKTQQMTAQDMLLQGKAAMVYANWIIRYVKDTETYPHDFVTGFAPVPKLSEDQEHLYTGGLSDTLSINAKSEHPEEAMEFLYWYITEGVTYLAEYGRIGAYSGLDKEALAEKVFSDCADLFDLESAQKFYLTLGEVSVRTNVTASTEINTILTEEFEKTFAGEQSIDDAITISQERAQKAFEEAQSAE